MPKRYMRLAAILLLLPASGSMSRVAPSDDLETLIRRQTEEFSAAGRNGDRAAVDRLLDDHVVFTSERGDLATKRDLLEGLAPASGGGTLEVTDFAMVPQGDVATATFTDVLKREQYGRTVETRFRSTETWARRGSVWRMIASHTMTLPGQPEERALTHAQLDEYVGVYKTGAETVVAVRREGGSLTYSLNGGPRQTLVAEYADVFFVSGAPALRRTFLRDGRGQVESYLVSQSGTDFLLAKAS